MVNSSNIESVTERYTSEQVAADISSAQKIIHNSVNMNDLVSIEKIKLLLALLESVKLLSASANEFLGLRGLGLEETLILVKKINSENKFDIKSYNFNFRKILESF